MVTDDPKTTMTLEPFSDFIVVRVHEEQASGQLIIPKTVEVRIPLVATVCAAGPGYVTPAGALVPMPVAVGDIVLLQFGAGTDIRLGDEVFKILPARDLFGRFATAPIVLTPSGALVP